MQISRRQVIDEVTEQVLGFARREFEIAGLEPDVRDVLEGLLSVLSEHFPSGFAAGYISMLFSRLVEFLPLTALTGEDSEWEKIDDEFEVNVRCPSLMRTRSRGVRFQEARVWCDVSDPTHPASFVGMIIDHASGAVHNSWASVKFPFYPKSYMIRVRETEKGTHEILDKEILIESYRYYCEDDIK